MVRGEFTIYPFIEGNALPPYVQVAIDAIKEAGLEVDVGPLSNTVMAATAEQVIEALRRAESAALAAGAQRIVIRLEVEIPLPRSSRSLRVEINLDAVEAAERAVSALVPKDSQVDLPMGGFTHMDRAIDELIQLAEAQIRLPIGQMSRAQKQQVVRFLDERGAFNLKKSVETVADALGVSRFTVYNYLDSSRQT